MKHCIVMVCELFGNSNLSTHVELVLAGYESTGVSWRYCMNFLLCVDLNVLKYTNYMNKLPFAN